MLQEEQTAHSWKWVISVSQEADVERVGQTSEVIFKNVFPFPTCTLGEDGDCSGDFCQASLHGFCRHTCLPAQGFGDVFRMGLFAEVLCSLCRCYNSVGAWPWPGAPTQALGLPSTFLSVFCLPFTLLVYAQVAECKTSLCLPRASVSSKMPEAEESRG